MGEFKVKEAYEYLKHTYGKVTPEIMDELVSIGEYTSEEANEIYNYQFKNSTKVCTICNNSYIERQLFFNKDMCPSCDIKNKLLIK